MSTPSRIPTSERTARIRRAPVILINGEISGTIHRSERDPMALIVGLTNGYLARDGLVVYVPSETRQFFIALAVASPGIVSREEMAEILWGDDEDGGPDNTFNNLRQHFMKAKNIAAALRYRIECISGRGWCAWPTRDSMANAEAA